MRGSTKKKKSVHLYRSTRRVWFVVWSDDDFFTTSSTVLLLVAPSGRFLAVFVSVQKAPAVKKSDSKKLRLVSRDS